MTDREILIWYESLEGATCNTDSPESAIVAHVRKLIYQEVLAAEESRDREWIEGLGFDSQPENEIPALIVEEAWEDRVLAAEAAVLEPIIKVVREVGESRWDAPMWNLHVPRERANKLFEVVYSFDTPARTAALDKMLEVAGNRLLQDAAQEISTNGVYRFEHPGMGPIRHAVNKRLEEARREMRERTDEPAWLIEKGQLCLGFCGYRFRWVTFTDENAFRFSRKLDAHHFLVSMKKWEPKAWEERFEGAKITEHLWDNTPRALPLTADTHGKHVGWIAGHCSDPLNCAACKAGYSDKPGKVEDGKS